MKSVRARGLCVLTLGTMGCSSVENKAVEPVLLRTPQEVASLPAPVHASIDAWRTDLTACQEAYAARNAAEVAADAAAVRARYQGLVERGGYRAAVQAETLTYVRGGPGSENRSAEHGNWDATLEELARRTVPCTEPEVGAVNQEPITPGGLFMLFGCAFGESAGSASLSFTITDPAHVDPCNGSRTPDRVELRVENWSDDMIVLELLPPVSGYVDQTAMIEVVRADGSRSIPFPVDFFAQRQTRRLPTHYLDFEVQNPETDDSAYVIIACDNSPNTPLGAHTFRVDSTFVVDHYHDCCYPQVASTDLIHLTLFNGWTFLDSRLESTGRVDLELGNEPGNLTHFPWNPPLKYPQTTRNGAVSILTFTIHWWVDHVESGVSYYGQIDIEGPAGTYFGDPARFNPLECEIGKSCGP